MEKGKDINLEILAQETEGFSPSDIAQACQEALKKAILEDRKQLKGKDLQWGILEQERKKKVKGRSNADG